MLSWFSPATFVFVLFSLLLRKQNKPGYKKWGQPDLTFIRAAGLNGHRDGENDAMILWVYKDYLRLVRYFIPAGLPMKPVEGPITVWTCEGNFSEYCRPEPEKK